VPDGIGVDIQITDRQNVDKMTESVNLLLPPAPGPAPGLGVPQGFVDSHYEIV
jgi:hypothetical protein